MMVALWVVVVVAALGFRHPVTFPPRQRPWTYSVVGSSSGTAGSSSSTSVVSSSLVAKSRRVYDPLAAEALFWRQPARWLYRNLQIFLPLGKFVASVGLDVATEREEERRSRRAEELTRIISDLGPAIIKAGQALASRPDLLPAEYLRELQKLQDRVPPFSTEVALRRVEASLGLEKFEDAYELLQDTPVAAASIGQVYRAKLRENDNVVALKVQRPGCEEVIALDLFILRWWARQVRDVLKLLFNRDLDLVGVIDDFGDIIYREIDYVAEAENAARFAELYGEIFQVKVPRVYFHLTTGDVLTMEWIEGTRLVDGEELRRRTGDVRAPARLVDTLVQCSLRQMLESGYFHADPHAGNLLATEDGRLCYLDFGMMSYLEENQRLSIIEAVVHLVNRDFDALADLYVRMGFIASDVDVRPIVDGLAAALPDVLDASVAELNVKNVVSRLGDVMYTFPFRLPPFYVAIIRCLGVLEGVAIQVDPEFRIVSDAYPYIASRLLTDEAPELKAALTRLLFKDDKPQWARFEALLERASGSSDYDAARVVDVLVDLVAADAAAATRTNLVTDVVAALDSLGVDAARSMIKIATGVDLPPPPPVFGVGPPFVVVAAAAAAGVDRRHSSSTSEQREDPPPAATGTLLRAAQALQARSLAALADLDSAAAAVSRLQSYIPLAQRVANEPVLRQMATEIAAEVAERAASRAIRLALLPLATDRS
ncbi:hypothetical protein CTAYLR_002033 [Chrysophaeum taylorii]|uniref:Protein kinase domain-containing protein n=1 Tax=Chrysophaeum taylorii TaxID=2483200 RepID=A0AAD7XRB0_9STRA|nr:hypothetical protein CTAYLR_002033 [Chrysophaeum taylorii]